MEQETAQAREPGMLVLVATPIGNLGDFSRRAVEALEQADFIAAEDTRVTLRLLNHFAVKKPLVSYFEHNKAKRGAEILRRIEAGETCALVTDAGMPAISDPGEDLVALCGEHGIRVTVVPGACAAVSALAVSGLPTGRFCFEGFLSVHKKSRREHLQAVKDDARTLIFYEAPHKLPATLQDMLAELGDRRVTLVRELTKLHEEISRTTLAQAAEYYAQHSPRGEFVLVVEGRSPQEREARDAAAEDPVEAAAGLVRRMMEQGTPHSEAVREAAARTGVRRAALYKATVAQADGMQSPTAGKEDA